MNALTPTGPARHGRRSSRELQLDSRSLPEMLEFHSPTAALMVTPVLPAARPVVWLVATLAASCITAAGMIPIDRVVTARGRIVADQATSVVQPLETAIVRSIDVHEGDVVVKGQLLARLDPTFAAADLSTYQAQVASLTTEVKRLQAEASGSDFRSDDGSPTSVLQGAIFLQRKGERAFKNENYAQKINSLQQQVQRGLSDVHGYSERLKVATEVEAKRRELERLKVGSQLNLLAATDNRLEIRRGLDSAVNQAAQYERDLQALAAERDAYNQNWLAQVSQDLTDQTRKLSDAQESLKKAALRRQMVELRADQNAVVMSVAKVSSGSVLQSGEQLITLVPENAALEAEVNIAGSDAGFVHPGNTVDMKLDTLPYTQYGTVTGSIRVLSPDSFTTADPDQPKRGSQPQPQTMAAYYRGRITLGTTRLHDVPEGFHFMPGLPVTADIKVGKRTLIGYLLGRVLPAFRDSMREP